MRSTIWWLYHFITPKSIKQLQTCSRQFCAVSINSCGCSADATERLKNVLGDIAGFISSTAHHFVVVAGDWNTETRRVLWCCLFISQRTQFVSYRPVFPWFTYLGHDGSKSWLDHIAVSNCFCSSVVSVHSIWDGRNLSDHNQLAFSLDLSTPVAPCSTSTPDVHLWDGIW